MISICQVVVSKFELGSWVEFLTRVDFLHRKVAWSRLGGIAYITPDGSEVRFRCLKFNAVNVNWGLSKEYPVVQRASNGESHPFVHLEWSQTGMDLGVADSVGRISVFTFSATAINVSTAAPMVHVDQQNELDRAVGMLWLNPDRQVSRVILCSPIC
jgi:mediator of RNA polymerase II transcription subunit 16